MIFAADSMMLAARPPRVRIQPSPRIRDAVTGEYKPPGSEAAFSTPLSLGKKISHRIVCGHAISRPAKRRTSVGLIAQIVALPREALAKGATPGTDTGPLKIEASLADTEVHTGPLPHDAWRTSRLSSSTATRHSVAQPAVVAMGSSGFLCERKSRTTGPPYRFSMLSKNDKFDPRSAQPRRDNARRPSDLDADQQRTYSYQELRGPARWRSPRHSRSPNSSLVRPPRGRATPRRPAKRSPGDPRPAMSRSWQSRRLPLFHKDTRLIAECGEPGKPMARQ